MKTKAYEAGDSRCRAGANSAQNSSTCQGHRCPGSGCRRGGSSMLEIPRTWTDTTNHDSSWHCYYAAYITFMKELCGQQWVNPRHDIMRKNYFKSCIKHSPPNKNAKLLEIVRRILNLNNNCGLKVILTSTKKRDKFSIRTWFLNGKTVWSPFGKYQKLRVNTAKIRINRPCSTGKNLM
jgi:hypothetical protein